MKKLVLIFIFIINLNADINTAIKDMIGYKAYSINKNLINFIFKNKNSFYSDENINYIKLSQTLKNNNLLNLKLPYSTYINIEFAFINPSSLALLETKDILKRYGYYYYFTNSLEKGNNLIWKIKLKTSNIIDPLILAKELEKRQAKLINVVKKGNNHWYYEINSANIQSKKAKDLINSDQVSLKKSFKPYILKVANANTINIQSKKGNNWFPNIVFYDDKMNIIDIHKDYEEKTNLELDVPEDTKYIKIDDIYSLYNLKRGILITKE